MIPTPASAPPATANPFDFGGAMPSIPGMGNPMEMMNNPMMQQMLDNMINDPQTFEAMMNNPMVKQAMAGNPMMAGMLENPEMMRQ